MSWIYQNFIFFYCQKESIMFLHYILFHLVDEHLSCFQIGDITNKAAMNNSVEVCVHTYILIFSWVKYLGVSHVVRLFNFIRYWKLFPKVTIPFCILTSNIRVFPSYTLANTWHCQFFTFYYCVFFFITFSFH